MRLLCFIAVSIPFPQFLAYCFFALLFHHFSSSTSFPSPPFFLHTAINPLAFSSTSYTLIISVSPPPVLSFLLFSPYLYFHNFSLFSPLYSSILAACLTFAFVSFLFSCIFVLRFSVFVLFCQSSLFYSFSPLYFPLLFSPFLSPKSNLVE